MLSLPERVAEPTPQQVLREWELDALRAFKARYESGVARAERLMVAAGYSARNAQPVGSRLRFVAWLVRTGRVNEGAE